jgi:hypothetical protein
MNIEEFNFPKASQLDEEVRHERLIKVLKIIKQGLFEAKEQNLIGMKFEVKFERSYGTIPDDLLDEIKSFLKKYEYYCEVSEERLFFSSIKFLYVYFKK